MRTDESSSSPLKRSSATSVTSPSPAPSTTRTRHVSVYVPPKNDSTLSEAGQRLKNLIHAVNVPAATKKYFTYLFDWPKTTDLEVLRVLAEMLCSEGGQKLLTTHVRDTSTDFSFLKQMVRSLSDCMVAPQNAELRRWSVLCLYQIKTKIHCQIQRREDKKQGGKKGSLVMDSSSHPYENLLRVQFSEFYATQKLYSPFEAIDYNALLEIALNKIRSPKNIEGGKVTSDAKVEPWNAPLGKDGCEIMELATRMQTMRTLERVQEIVTDWYVFLSILSVSL